MSRQTATSPTIAPSTPAVAQGAGVPRPYTPNDILRQVVLEDHDVSPDGRFAVVVRRFVLRGRYASHLWLVPLTGRGRPIQLTDGAVRDRHPAFRPDGRALAFQRSILRAEHEADSAHDPARLMILELGADEPAEARAGRGRARASGAPDAARREPWPVFETDLHVGELAWAPDGRRIAFTAETDPPRFLVPRPGAEPGPVRPPRVGASEPAPLGRLVRRIDWRYDETGHVDRWDQLFVVEARRRARPRQVTTIEGGASGIAWRPDGGAIAFTSDPRPDSDLLPRTSIWAVSPDGGEPTEVLALGGNAYSAAWSPDGRWLAAVGIVDADALDDVSPELVVVAADGTGRLRRLAPDLDRPIGAWHDSDLNGWMNSGQSRPVWLDDRTLVAQVSDRGRTVPWRFPIDPGSGEAAGPPAPMVEGSSADAACWTLRAAGGRVSALGLLDGRAQELLIVEEGPEGGHSRPEGGHSRPEGGHFRAATRLGSTWQAGRIVPDRRCVEAPGSSGPIETWIISPPDAGERPLPTIVDVHGGPLGAWAPTPSLEVLLLVSRGWRVVLPNIRGSATYGRAWIRPQLGDWGGVDAADVHAALDHVVELGLADPDRLGVLGLSYGGFMVDWLVGTSERFRAAVSENGVANQVSAWANSDTGPEYCRTSLLGDPFTPEGVDKLWRQSPLRHVASIRTPLLMLQAEADRRCPATDNEQLFIALRLLRREVEFVLYPDEYHVYATTGRPDRRIDRMTRMLDWFDRHLKG